MTPDPAVIEGSVKGKKQHKQIGHPAGAGKQAKENYFGYVLFFVFFFTASHLVCFRCENTVINVVLSAGLKIALHLLPSIPIGYKGYCLSRQMDEAVGSCRREREGGGLGSMLMRG